MSTFKRLTCVILAIVMFAGILPTAGFAADKPDGFNYFIRRNLLQPNTFNDISESDWFYVSVKSAYELGLMIGKENGNFDPTSGITIAETLTIAARLNYIYEWGMDVFPASTPWYQTYVDYAVSHGIITSAPKNANAPATRAYYAAVMAKALPDEALQEINNVADGAIPDVKLDDKYGNAVYKLYRAGILTGNDKKGTFAPDSAIKRSEVAAIVARMVDISLRKKITLNTQKTSDINVSEPPQTIDNTSNVRHLDGSSEQPIVITLPPEERNEVEVTIRLHDKTTGDDFISANTLTWVVFYRNRPTTPCSPQKEKPAQSKLA